jgi:dipeptidyl-peptidase-4
MRFREFAAVLAVGLAIWSAAAHTEELTPGPGAGPDMAAAATDQDGGYDKQVVSGRAVFASVEFARRDPLALDRCVAALARNLQELATTLPPSAWDKLRGVPVWLEYEDSQSRTGWYYPSSERSKNAGSIHFTKELAALIVVRPTMVLHELAHAYHDQVLGFQNPAIRAAYVRARRSLRYETVLRSDGQLVAAYAMLDERSSSRC